MSTTTPDGAKEPLYESLVEQHGDVLAETREAAEATGEEAALALDWSDLHSVREEELGTDLGAPPGGAG